MSKRKVHIMKKLVKEGQLDVTWNNMVKYAMHGKDIDTQGVLRKKYLDVNMRSTLKLGEKQIEQTKDTRAAAQAALARGEAKIEKSGTTGMIGAETALAKTEYMLHGTGEENLSSVPESFNAWSHWKKELMNVGTEYEMGHTNFGVSTAATTIYLEALDRMEGTDTPEYKKLRQELKALLLAQQNLDSFTYEQWVGLNRPSPKDTEAGIAQILSKTSKMAEKGYDITNDRKLIADIANNKADVVAIIEMEETAFNKWKGQVSNTFADAVKAAWISQTFGNLGDAMQDLVDEIPYIEGSKSIIGALTEQVIDLAVSGKSKAYKSKSKAKTTHKINNKDLKKAKKKIDALSKKGQRELRALAAVNPRAAGASGESSGTGSSQNLGKLLALLNAKLPQTVVKNMGPPGLENRTGRFASSVKATDVSRTAQGHPSIGYTYQKNPYQVFEMSHGDPRWATTQRDPRKLIDASIREIAAQLAIGRFYTRRV